MLEQALLLHVSRSMGFTISSQEWIFERGNLAFQMFDIFLTSVSVCSSSSPAPSNAAGGRSDLLACVLVLGSFLSLPHPRLGWSEGCEPGAREVQSLFLGKLVSACRFSAIVYYLKIFLHIYIHIIIIIIINIQYCILLLLHRLS